MTGRVLYERILRLGRGEEGVAMVVTLAVFMFLYVVCMGVYAVGNAAKEKVHLQNACDAAAYSAAVVQADALSRLATINRAMAWTYAQMSRRQMDYIVWWWLNHMLVGHFDRDVAVAKAWHQSSCHGGHWFSPVVLNGHNPDNPSEGDYVIDSETLRTAIERVGNHVRAHSSSFYDPRNPTTREHLGRQILSDKSTIRAMNSAERDIVTQLPGRIDRIVAEMLAANLRLSQDSRSVAYHVRQSANPASAYMRQLSNNAADEALFLSWQDYSSSGINTNSASEIASNPARYVIKTLKKGNVATRGNGGVDEWFERVPGNGTGIQRRYRPWVKGTPLYATWRWWSWRCGGHLLSGQPDPARRIWRTSQCPHYYSRCWCETSSNPSDRMFHAHGENGNGARKPYSRTWPLYSTVFSPGYSDYSGISYSDTTYNSTYYEGERAYPYVLTRNYFGSAGAITVAVAKKNANPWISAIGAGDGNGTSLRGIFAAFNHFPGCGTSICFSSAKAGYKHLGEDVPEVDRRYRIDWNSARQAWNLCQSDWDAVFIPVRKADALAENGRWSTATSAFSGWVADLASKGKTPSGISQPTSLTGMAMQSGGGADVSGQIDKGSQYVDGVGNAVWHNLSPTVNRKDNYASTVQARWNVESAGRPVKWDRLSDVMLH